MLIFAIKSQKFLKTLFLNLLIGMTLLALVNITSGITGVEIPLNRWTVFGSMTFGIPAVCGFLIANLIFV